MADENPEGAPPAEVAAAPADAEKAEAPAPRTKDVKDPHCKAVLIMKELALTKEKNAAIEGKLQAAREKRTALHPKSVDKSFTPITLLSTHPEDKNSWKVEWQLSDPSEVSGSFKQYESMAKVALEKEKEMFRMDLRARQADEEKRRKRQEEVTTRHTKRNAEKEKHEAQVNMRVAESRRKQQEDLLLHHEARMLRSTKMLAEIQSKREAKLVSVIAKETATYHSVVNKLLKEEGEKQQKVVSQFEKNELKRNVDSLKNKFFPMVEQHNKEQAQKEELFRQKWKTMQEEDITKRQEMFKKTLKKMEGSTENRTHKVEQIQKKVVEKNEHRAITAEAIVRRNIATHVAASDSILMKERKALQKLIEHKQRVEEHHEQVLIKQKETVKFRDTMEELAFRTQVDKKKAEIYPDRPLMAE